MNRIGKVLFALIISNQVLADTPYGNCPERAQAYQDRYEQHLQARDLVCYQKALTRELNNNHLFNCPLSAQHYQTAYEQHLNIDDLICYMQTLKRELLN